MPALFDLQPGDEILLVRRRKTTKQVTNDEGTARDEPVVEDTTFAAVRVADQMIVAGGWVDPQWEDDQQYLVVKLKAGQAQ